MSGLSNLIGKPLKHYARDMLTNQRYIIISLQNETDKETCSVVDMDALETDIRSELTNYVNSDECQRQMEIWKLLDRKYFMSYPKATMLNVLKQMRQIKVVKSSQVAIQLPNDQTMTPIELLNAIQQYENQKNAKVGSFNMDNVSSNVTNNIENKNAEEILAIKEDVKSINEKIGSLTSSIEELVAALRTTTKAKK